MTGPTGFILPHAAINRAYFRLLPWVLAGLLLPPLLGMTSIAVAIESSVIVAVLIGGVYLYTRRYEWVYLSSDGIQGSTSKGKRIHIPWGDEVTITGTVAFNGIECLALQPRSKGRPLLLPRSIANTPEFKATLAQVAPAAHPLRSTAENAL